MAIYALFSWVHFKQKVAVTPQFFSGILANNHRLLMNLQYTNNEQSRILQFLIPEAIRTLLFVSVEHAYEIQRFTFVFLTFLFFDRYLRKWFRPAEALAGVCMMSTLIMSTYLDDLQESFALLMFTYLLGLGAIRDHKKNALSVILWIAALNNETSLSLLIVFFFYNLSSKSLKGLLASMRETFLVGAPAIISTMIIRYITRNQPHLGGALHFKDNWAGIVSGFLMNPLNYYESRYTFFILIFGLLIGVAFSQFSKISKFSRSALMVIPFFILAHLITGVISEPRQMSPLLLIIIPITLKVVLQQDSSPQKTCFAEI